MQIFLTVLFFILLVAYMTGLIMYMAEVIIEEFNTEFDNIESGGRSDKK